MADKNPKNIIHVEITDSVGDGGTFYGDHIVVGDPFENPPSNWEHGQLLFDGNEEDAWAGDGDGGGGPHEHTQYAQIVHDHDYLPLEGGTLTGNLIVDGVANLRSFGVELKVGCYGIAGHAGNPAFSSVLDPTTGMYVSYPGRLNFTLAGTDALWINEYGLYSGRTFYGLDGTATYPGYSFNDDPQTGIYRAASGVVGVAGDLQVDGDIHGTEILLGDGGKKIWGGTVGDSAGSAWLRMVVDDEWRLEVTPTRVAMKNNLWVKGGLTVDGKINGQSVFGIADGIDTRDVLERAETATMPAPDDEGVATTDADVESLTVNEVITAMLAKIKELSAEIKELKGA